jgi:hypothetical protein
MLDEILRISGVFVGSPDQCLQIRLFSPAVITTVFALWSACNGDVVLATPLHTCRLSRAGSTSTFIFGTYYVRDASGTQYVLSTLLLHTGSAAALPSRSLTRAL